MCIVCMCVYVFTELKAYFLYSFFWFTWNYIVIIFQCYNFFIDVICDIYQYSVTWIYHNLLSHSPFLFSRVLLFPSYRFYMLILS